MQINIDELNEATLKVKEYPNASLLLVTKNRPQSLVKSLIEKGYILFGENRVQEAKEKFSDFADQGLELHLIGPLQTNKVKVALNLFSTIQTIDRPKLIKEISKYTHLNPDVVTRDYYIQINIGEEQQKAGVLPDHFKDLYNLAISHKLKIAGLMCIPPLNKDPSSYFKKMIDLRDSINTRLKLSMGMSNDYEVALSHQSDLVRIGSKIFK